MSAVRPISTDPIRQELSELKDLRLHLRATERRFQFKLAAVR